MSNVTLIITKALAEYPLARKTLLEKGKALLRKDDLLDEDVASEMELMEKNALEANERLNLIMQELGACGKRVEKMGRSYRNGMALLKKRLDVQCERIDIQEPKDS